MDDTLYRVNVTYPTTAEQSALCVQNQHDNRVYGNTDEHPMCWRCYRQLHYGWSKWAKTVWSKGALRMYVTLVDPVVAGWMEIPKARIKFNRVGNGHIAVVTPWTGPNNLWLTTTVIDGWRVLKDEARIQETLVQKLLAKLGEV